MTITIEAVTKDLQLSKTKIDQLTEQSPTRDPQIQNITSHDTYLTVLVELGVIGLALLVLPWVVISRRAIAGARRGLVEPWIVAGCVGTAVSFWIGALTYDARFFPIITALPWITLGLARSTLRKPGIDIVAPQVSQR